METKEVIHVSIPLLRKELKDLLRCALKSGQMYARGAISYDLHLIHITNLWPQILELERDIAILKQIK